MTFISYAQNYEDLLLWRVFGGMATGTYVDVGAQDPVEDSVTKAFYDSGWHGMNLEPVAHWYDALLLARPRDINLAVAASDHDGTSTFYDVVGTGLSTTDAAIADGHREAGLTVVGRRVATSTLDSLLARHGLHTVHFLKIDCEGAEARVLQGLGLVDVRPWVILVEANRPNSREKSHGEWEPRLLAKNYVFAHDDGLNRYYVAAEHTPLVSLLAVPPNVFDDFVRLADHRAHANFAAATREVKRLGARLIAVEASCDAANSRESTLLAQVQIARQESARRLASQREVAASTERRLLDAQRSLLDQVQALQAESAARGQHLQAILASHSWRITAPMRAGSTLARCGLRFGWRRVRPWVVPLARSAKPLLRAMLRVRFVRAVASRLLGPQSSLGHRARLFLFARVATEETPSQSPLARTATARVVEAELRAAIRRSRTLS